MTTSTLCSRSCSYGPGVVRWKCDLSVSVSGGQGVKFFLGIVTAMLLGLPLCCEPYGDTMDFSGSDLSEVKHGKIRAAKPELVQQGLQSSWTYSLYSFSQLIYI